MLRSLYNWIMRLASGPYATWAMAAVAFSESAFFPVPPDVMLAPMTLAKPERAFRYALICTVCSVCGGMMGYAIGYFAQPFGQWLLALMGHKNGLHEFQHWMSRFGLAVILIKGLLPVPFKIVTIGAGLARFNFFVFVAASVVTRGGRFFLTAALLKRFGPQVKDLVERRMAWAAAALVLFAAAGMGIVKLIEHFTSA